MVVTLCSCDDLVQFDFCFSVASLLVFALGDTAVVILFCLVAFSDLIDSHVALPPLLVLN